MLYPSGSRECFPPAATPTLNAAGAQACMASFLCSKGTVKETPRWFLGCPAGGEPGQQTAHRGSNSVGRIRGDARALAQAGAQAQAQALTQFQAKARAQA